MALSAWLNTEPPRQPDWPWEVWLYRIMLLVCWGLILGLLLLCPWRPTYAESIMSPLSQSGRMVDSFPPPPWATPEERLQKLEDAATAYCLQGYHLEHRSTGLTCVKPAGR